jgi:hypothetical protein
MQKTPEERKKSAKEKKARKRVGKEGSSSLRNNKLDAIEEEAEEEEKDVSNESELGATLPKSKVDKELIDEIRTIAREEPKHPFLPHKYEGNLLQTYFKHSLSEVEQ